MKEYLSRGTYIFRPEPSRRLTVDLICHTVRHVPKWNPINVCSYHLQEAGATPVQELAYALATAIGVLDAVRDSGQVSDDEFPEVVGRISFFVNAGIRFVEEMCKMRAFGRAVGPHLPPSATASTDEKLRRFRYGVQVNSLGLTEAQPENNVQRIVLEMLGVTLSKDARARAVQLPCWNEALGLPRPWDQQWSLRIQQVLAYETDLLEYDDLFDGSHVVEAKTAELAEAAEAELQWVLDGGGAFAMIDEMKGRLVQSHAERVRRIESGDDHRSSASTASPRPPPSPLVDIARRRVAASSSSTPRSSSEQIEPTRGVARRRATPTRSTRALDDLRDGRRRRREPHARDDRARPRRRHRRRVGRRAARGVRRVPRARPASAACARRPATGDGRGARARVQAAAASSAARSASSSASPASTATRTAPSRSRSPPATPAWRSSTRASASRPSRSRPRRATRTSTSSASRSCRAPTSSSCPRRMRLLREPASTRRSWSAASSPRPTRPELLAAGVARVYTPKDFRVTEIVAELADLATAR